MSLLSSDGTWTYTYDGNGNRITRSKVGETWTYAWDLHNRLKSVSKNGTTVASYTYDVENFRIAKTKGSAVTVYAYRQDGVIAYQKDLTTLTARTYAYIGSTTLGWTDTKADGTQTKYFAVTDQIGSVTQVTDGTGAAVWSSEYLAFGVIAGRDGPYDFDGVYAGHEYDADVGLVYMWNRWMDPATGGFISEDPARQGINWYAYAGNGPLNIVDPTGLWGLDLGIIKLGDAAKNGGIEINLGIADLSVGLKGSSIEIGIPNVIELSAGVSVSNGEVFVGSGLSIGGVSIVDAGVDLSFKNGGFTIGAGVSLVNGLANISAGFELDNNGLGLAVDSDIAGIPMFGAAIGVSSSGTGGYVDAYATPFANFYADAGGNVRIVAGLWALNHGKFANTAGWTGDWFWNEVYGNYAGLTINGQDYEQQPIDEVDEIAYHHDRDSGRFSDKSIVAGSKARDMLRSRYWELSPYKRVGLRSLGMLETLGYITRTFSGGTF